MVKSIRWRLQLWYAAVLGAILVGFGGLMYLQASRTTFQRIDLQLSSAVRYLEAALRSFPRQELESSLGSQRPEPPPRGWEHPGDGPPGPHGPPPHERGPPGPFDRPSFEDDRGPGRHAPRPRPPGPPGPRIPRSELLASLALGRQSPEFPGAPRGEELYCTIWRSDDSVLKRESADIEPLEPAQYYRELAPRGVTILRRGGRREAVGAGPQETMIVVGQSIHRESAELAAFAGMLLLGGGVALSIGLFGGWLISARVLQPLAAISSAASSISATNLSRRIDCSQIDRELTDLADVLNQMFERLQSAFERQARFTADASHELRTPLSILYTNLQLALSRPRTEAEYRETIESGLRAAARMRSLIDGLLMLARADAGRLDIPWQPVDLNEIAAEVVEQFASLAERAQVHLLAERAPQSVFVTGEASMLARIAANLVSNAIRHTPAEGRIRVSVKTDGKQALLAVADTGCGIALEDQPKLFERFYRADAARARATGGCGLGLAISKSLAEAHHGTIGITSRPERGTCFVVRLPLAAGEIRPQKRVTLDDQR